MNPKELIEKWIELFNEGNPEKKKTEFITQTP